MTLSARWLRRSVFFAFLAMGNILRQAAVVAGIEFWAWDARMGLCSANEASLEAFPQMGARRQSWILGAEFAECRLARALISGDRSIN
ncbi:hypothetical protein BSN85_35595 [Bradyrhizobium brasilense]|nr:hypothetical protein BSN85_35595 [Bradyrhizobium brasilense]